MPEFGAKDIQQLRQDAGVGMMDAKIALTDAGGDLEKAFELLRERGQAKMAKRTDREANEGAIGSYIHIQSDRPVVGVLVELTCETDFVAKSAEFRETANDIAMHVSWGKPMWVTRDEVDQDALAKERELISRQALAEGKPENVDRSNRRWEDRIVVRRERALRPEIRKRGEVRRHCRRHGGQSRVQDG